jgi:hypothetical protein
VIRLHDEEDGGGEPVRGLPQALPEGETLLWQGRPGTLAFAVHAFHIRFIAAYCALAAGWRMANLETQGAGVAELTRTALNAGLGALGGIGLIVLIAWVMARSTVYTITSRRVVIRYGAAIRKYVNLPFEQIVSADMRRFGGAVGDIVLALPASGGLGYLRLWPHVRPLHFSRPQPMLRSLKDVDAAAGILAAAIKARAPEAVSLSPAPVVAPPKPRVQPAPGLPAGAH